MTNCLALQNCSTKKVVLGGNGSSLYVYHFEQHPVLVTIVDLVIC